MSTWQEVVGGKKKGNGSKSQESSWKPRLNERLRAMADALPPHDQHVAQIREWAGLAKTSCLGPALLPRAKKAVELWEAKQEQGGPAGRGANGSALTAKQGSQPQGRRAARGATGSAPHAEAPRPKTAAVAPSRQARSYAQAAGSQRTVRICEPMEEEDLQDFRSWHGEDSSESEEDDDHMGGIATPPVQTRSVLLQQRANEMHASAFIEAKLMDIGVLPGAALYEGLRPILFPHIAPYADYKATPDPTEQRAAAKKLRKKLAWLDEQPTLQTELEAVINRFDPVEIPAKKPGKEIDALHKEAAELSAAIEAHPAQLKHLNEQQAKLQQEYEQACTALDRDIAHCIAERDLNQKALIDTNARLQAAVEGLLPAVEEPPLQPPPAPAQVAQPTNAAELGHICTALLAHLEILSAQAHAPADTCNFFQLMKDKFLEAAGPASAAAEPLPGQGSSNSPADGMDGAEHAAARGDTPVSNAEGVTEVTGAHVADRTPARTAGTRKMCTTLPPPHAADQAAAVLVAQAKAQREAKLDLERQRDQETPQHH